MRLRVFAIAAAVVMATGACSAGSPPAPPHSEPQIPLPLTAVVRPGVVGTDLHGNPVKVSGPEVHAVIPTTYDGALRTAVVLTDGGPVAVPRSALFPPRADMAPRAVVVRGSAGLRGDGTLESISGGFDAWVQYGAPNRPVSAEALVGGHWVLLGAEQFKVTGRAHAPLPEPDSGWLPGTGHVAQSTLAPTLADALAGEAGSVQLVAEAEVTALYPLRPRGNLSEPVIADGKLVLAEHGTLDEDGVTDFAHAWCDVPDGTPAIFPGGRGALEGGKYPLRLGVIDPARGSGATMTVLTVWAELGGYAVIKGACTPRAAN
jgi:hypothetical protein